MKTQAYDLIGDIHGQHAKLTSLLGLLGYQRRGDSYCHPEGRKVVFLGDHIDRGPAIRETLLTVRAMCDSGDALAIMGNHEYNAVCFHTPDGNAGYLRQHTERNVKQHRATLDQFAGLEVEWKEWLEWFKQLPFALDLGGLRAVHACWDERRLPLLQKATLQDKVFLQASATPTTAEHRAIENVLKGPEIELPDGEFFTDKEGVKRRTVRARWWDLHQGVSLGDLAMPPGSLELEARPLSGQLRRVMNYGAGEPPVFFGHYWLPSTRKLGPLKPNVVCLDYSAGREGPLVAYRWNGESEADAKNYISTNGS